MKCRVRTAAVHLTQTYEGDVYLAHGNSNSPGSVVGHIYAHVFLYPTSVSLPGMPVHVMLWP